MKGIIFNVVEEVVTTDHGVDAWEDMLDNTGVMGAYTAVGSYDDGELVALVDAASEMTGQTQADLLRHVGRQGMPLLRTRYPEFFEVHESSRSFLNTLNEVIHPEVRKLYEGAEPPLFAFSEGPDASLLMEYHSQRSMCALAEGLILGAGDSYAEQLKVNQLMCKLNGAPHCLINVVFP